MKYVKLKLSFGDKLRLLFLGVIPEEKLPEREVVRIVQTTENTQNVTVQSPSANINTVEEEEFSIPFFNINDEETKSNF